MSLFLTLLPIYLFGNLHCLGMCGPLVMMISQHRYKSYYFMGRLFSYAFAGMLAAEVGAVLNESLREFHIQTICCFLFGFILLNDGFSKIFNSSYKKLSVPKMISKPLMKINRYLATLLLEDKAISTFSFGFFTVLLPCGQTLLVFSACALSGDLFSGILNGFMFALLTSPSLYFSMNALSYLHRFKHYGNKLVSYSSIFIGIVTLCRGLAEIELIDHLVINSYGPEFLHIILY